MIESLETRTHLSIDSPWRSVNAQIDAAAGADLKVFDSVVDNHSGRTYLLGLADRQVTIVALGPNGKVDTTFGGGAVRLPSGQRYDDGVILDFDRPAVASIGPEGHLFVATGTEVTKFRADGGREQDFGRRGVQAFASSDLGLRIQDVLPTSDGRVLVATRILRNQREVFSTFEISDDSARQFFSTKRDSGPLAETPPTRGRQDAYLREGGGAFWLITRSKELTLAGDIVENAEAQVNFTVFSSRLKFASGGSIYVPPSHEVTDVRLFRSGSVAVATTNCETVYMRLKTGATGRSVYTDNYGDLKPLQTRIASDGTLWTAYDRASDDKQEILFKNYPRKGFDTSDESDVHLADNFGDEGTFRTFRLTDDNTLVLSTGTPSEGTSLTRHIRPGLDGPKVERVVIPNSAYVNVTYRAPYGVSKESVGFRSGSEDDLSIAGPNNVELASGASGHIRVENG